MHYNGGIISEAECPDTGSYDHGISIVGYTEEYYILRNQWGQAWGEEGYARLSKQGNTCGIKSVATYPTFK